jgi:hypothetical protein
MTSKARLDYRSVIINGKRYQALVDNQASLNIMSLAFVNKAGLTLRTDGTAFKLSNGSICHAVGRVHVHYKLTKSRQNCHKSGGKQEFYVLPKTIAPLVLGSPFLKEAKLSLGPLHGTLMPPQVPPSRPIPTPTSIRRYTRTCLKVYLTSGNNTLEAVAMPDKGASANMMSWLYANTAGYHIDRSPRNKVAFTLGNGHTIYAVGRVLTTIRFSQHTCLLDAIPGSFAVINGLPVDIVLSNPILRKHHILAGHQPQLQWIHFEEDIPGFHMAQGGEGGPGAKTGGGE